MIGFGDRRTSSIVAKIANEEVAHVAVGVYWFVFVCQKMGCTPGAAFAGEHSLLLLLVSYFEIENYVCYPVIEMFLV